MMFYYYYNLDNILTSFLEQNFYCYKSQTDMVKNQNSFSINAFFVQLLTTMLVCMAMF